MFALLAVILAVAAVVAATYSRQFYNPDDPTYATLGFAAPPMPRQHGTSPLPY